MSDYSFDKAVALRPFQPPNPEFELWAADHGCRLDSQVYRVEICIDWTTQSEPPYVIFYRYALNADGDKYWDYEFQDVARLEPLKVPLTSLPPVNWIYSDGSNIRQSRADCVH